ncbi:hypothetical protein FGO68_gene5423 [Halteria grandinella]|uniref:Uncharacterized protein n=1 Tax=Halteria grandinella TaxID=5974 RepID=A0A8J8P8Q3_HALGN|nr:hypothetical protein FGO68_gene5423 [Halteria grandinella]
MPTVFNNSYLEFDGQGGIWYKDTSGYTLDSYSISMWVKFSQMPDDLQRSITFFTAKSAFRCYLSRLKELRCQSQIQSGSYDLVVPSDNLVANNWYILVLRTDSSKCSLQIRHTDFDTVIVQQEKQIFFPGGTRQGSIQFEEITLGIDEDQRSQGMVGSVRNFQFLYYLYDDIMMKKIQYSVIEPQIGFGVQLLLKDMSEVRSYQSLQVQPISSSNIIELTDYKGANLCWQRWKNQVYSDIDPKGQLPSDANSLFDGVSCIDTQEKLLINSPSSNIKSQIRRTLNYTEGLSVEFWFKPTQSFSGEAFLFSLIASSTNTLAVIKMEKNNTLICYPSYTSQPRMGITYVDFSSTVTLWHHVSCLISSEMLQATFYSTSNQNAYVTDMNITYAEYTDFTVMLNGDGFTNTKGTRGMWLSEFRLWGNLRSVSEVANMRYHQLDVMKERTGLVMYFKLLSGAVDMNKKPMDFDLADVSFKRVVQITNDVSWIKQTDIVLCPLFTFKSEARSLDTGIAENLCFTEGIITLSLVIYKQSEDTYIITPSFSRFRNSLIQSQFTSQFYNFIWLYTETNIAFSDQRNFNTLITNQILNPQLTVFQSNVTGRNYPLTLTVMDKESLQDPVTIPLTFRPVSCLNIIDFEQRRSFVYKDLESAKGVSDIKFKYEATAAGCQGYVLDVSEMVFSIDLDGVSLSGGDHNSSAQTFTLRSQYQVNLPINQYFYLKIKAVWKVPKSSNRTELYLIYACRFVQKLLITLNPSSFTLLKGQSLTIKHSASFANMNNLLTKDKTYSVSWICPGDNTTLTRYCSSVTSDELRISTDLFASSGLPYWKAQTIWMVARTNFIQGDGSRMSNQSVQIQWLDVNSDATLFQVSPTNVTKNQAYILQVIVPSLEDSQI